MLWGGRIVPPTDPLYREVAAVHGLELALVLAIAEHESSFRQAAHNPEPPWRYFWDVHAWRPWRTPTAAEIASEKPPEDFPGPPPPVPRDAEWWGQQESWGLMQVMGGVARELGCRAYYLAELTADPAMAVDLGCRYLKRRLARFPRLEDAISAYNAGSPTWQKPGGNKDYVEAVTVALGRHRARLNAGGS